MKGLTNSKVINALDINSNEYRNFTTNVFTYNHSFIATQLRRVLIKCYDENNNVLSTYTTINGDIDFAYFDKTNKHFFEMSSNYGSQTNTINRDVQNVDHVTIQPTDNNMYYGFSLFY